MRGDVEWLPNNQEKPWDYPASTRYLDVKGRLVFMGRSKMIKNGGLKEQNEWEKKSLDEKWELVWGHAQKTAPARPEGHLSINYLSASDPLARRTPRTYADYINPRAYEHAHDPAWRSGSMPPA